METVKLSFLSAEDRELLLDQASTKRVTRGDIIIREGEGLGAIFIVREGFISVRKGDITLAYYGPGAVFGELSFLDHRPASATVVAEREAILDRIESGQLDSLLHTHRGFAVRFYRSLATILSLRVRDLNSTVSRHRSQQQAAGQMHTRRTQAGQLSARHLQQGLGRKMAALRQRLERTEMSLHRREMTNEQAAPHVGEVLDEIVELLEDQTSEDSLVQMGYNDLLSFRDTDQLSDGVGSYIFRESFSLVMSSAVMARLFCKPHGHPEDYAATEAILENEPLGDGLLGPLVDRWFLDRHICRTVRATRESLADLLVEQAQGLGEPLRVCELGSGTSAELFDALDRVADEPTSSIRAICIDKDPDALRQADAEADELGHHEHVRFVCADVVAMVRNPDLYLEPQHLFVAGGLFNYVDDDDVLSVLDWVYKHLIDGGSFVFTCTSPAIPDLKLMEHLLEWEIITRTSSDIQRLVERSRFGTGVRITGISDGLVHMATCRRAFKSKGS